MEEENLPESLTFGHSVIIRLTVDFYFCFFLVLMSYSKSHIAFVATRRISVFVIAFFLGLQQNAGSSN